MEATCHIYKDLLVYPGSSTIRGLLGNVIGDLRKVHEEAKAQVNIR
jgi:hypothetical protein